MTMRVTCPKCRSAFACPEEYRGRTLRCKKCGQSFVAGGPPVRKPEAAATPRGLLTPGRFAVAAVLAVLLGVGLPAAYFLLKKHPAPEGVAAGPATGPAPAIPPAPRGPTGKQEPPRDTGTKPPP